MSVTFTMSDSDAQYLLASLMNNCPVGGGSPQLFLLHKLCVQAPHISFYEKQGQAQDHFLDNLDLFLNEGVENGEKFSTMLTEIREQLK